MARGGCMYISRMIDNKEVTIELTEDEIYSAYQYQQYLLDVQYVMSRVKFDELHLVVSISRQIRVLLNTYDYKDIEQAFLDVVNSMKEEIIIK